MLQGSLISYRGKNYRVQDANGWKYIIVTDKGNRKRVGLNEINKPTINDCVFDYIFGGGVDNYPCPAMDFWIYRYRLGHRITIKEYAIKFNVKRKRA